MMDTRVKKVVPSFCVERVIVPDQYSAEAPVRYMRTMSAPRTQLNYQSSSIEISCYFRRRYYTP